VCAVGEATDAAGDTLLIRDDSLDGPRALTRHRSKADVNRGNVIERLYSMSGTYNDRGQYVYYGKVGGAVITGNEDGIKHCAMNILYRPRSRGRWA